MSSNKLVLEVAKGIKEFSNHQVQFKRKIKERIKDDNGVEYIKKLALNFNYEVVLKKITANTPLVEIQMILEKNILKSSKKESRKIELWKENRVDQKYTITFNKILKGFIKSKYYENWKAGIEFTHMFSLYITSKDGLNSTYEPDKSYNELKKFILTEIKKG